MSAALFLMLNTGGETDPQRRRRDWVAIGQAISVDGFLLMPVYSDDGGIGLELFDRRGTPLHTLPLAPMSFEPSAPYRLVPRAAGLIRAGRIDRVLIETQYTGDHKPGWATTTRGEPDATPNVQPVPDAG